LQIRRYDIQKSSLQEVLSAKELIWGAEQIFQNHMSRHRYPSHNLHSIPWIIVFRLIGLAIYFIIVAVLSALHFGNPLIRTVISFLIAPTTIALVVIFSLLFLVGEVFLALDFPLSLPGPLFNALGSVFLVSFLLQLLYLVDTFSGMTIFSLFKPLEALLYFLIFLIVLIVQYVHLFSRGWEGWNEKPPSRPDNQTKPQEPASYTSHHDVSWDEVEAEFRMMLYDFFQSIRNALKRKQ
jgi:hypothetical protein